jgi:hypothetical protein
MKPFLLTALVAASASTATAQQKIPVVELAPVAAKSTETFGSVFGVRQLPGGRLLVNDGTKRRVVMLDSALAPASVVIDSAAGTANSYGAFPSPIIPYLGDSTLFVDRASQSLLVIDPAGKVARAMAAPMPQDLPLLGQSGSAIDNRGRLVYRGFSRPARMPAPAANGAPTIPAPPDSAPILRADFDTRSVDTIGRVRSQGAQRTTMTMGDNGQMVGRSIVNPLPAVDEWAVNSDGAVAFVRGVDYHIDWLQPDGSREATGKIPFDWRRLTDEDKQKLVDSAKAAQAEREARMAEAAKNGGTGTSVAGDGAKMVMTEMVAVRGGVAVAGGGGGDRMPINMSNMKMETQYVPLSEMPDYYPPIRQGAVRADLDGNLWILPTTSAQSVAGELIYDVVNRKGELAHRVRIPAGRSIAGFGKGGVVYLMWRDGTNGWYVERTRLIGGGNVSQ